MGGGFVTWKSGTKFLTSENLIPISNLINLVWNISPVIIVASSNINGISSYYIHGDRYVDYIFTIFQNYEKHWLCLRNFWKYEKRWHVCIVFENHEKLWLCFQSFFIFLVPKVFMKKKPAFRCIVMRPRYGA